MDTDLTIDQAAQLLGISKDTVRRRIKLGEYVAEKRPGPYGDEYRLPAYQFEKAIEFKDVAPVTRQISISELKGAMQEAITEAVSNAVQAETDKLKEHIKSLETKLDKQEKQLDRHFRLLDEKLRIVTEKKKRSWWQLW